MAYSAPPTKSVGDTVAAADWNTYIRDNLIDLAARLLPVQYDTQGSEFTTTSTSYVDVTGITVNLTVSRQSTIVMIVSGTCKQDTAGQAVAFQGVINGVSDAQEISSALQSYAPLAVPPPVDFICNFTV